MNITTKLWGRSTALLLSRVVRTCRRKLRRTMLLIKFRYYIRHHEKWMWDYAFGMTRKKGVSDIEVYKAALLFKRKGYYKSLQYHIGLTLGFRRHF